MPVTLAMGIAYYVFFMPMVIATRMRMPTVMGMPMTMCTGTYTIGKHAAGTDWAIHSDLKGVKTQKKFTESKIGAIFSGITSRFTTKNLKIGLRGNFDFILGSRGAKPPQKQVKMGKK